MFHPGVLQISCADCREVVYDLQTGQKKTYRAGPKREVRCQLRGGTPPPCDKCPKGGPEREADCYLTPANWRVFNLYCEMRATAGTSLTETQRQNPMLLRRLALVDAIVRDHDREHQALELAHQVVKLIR